MRDSEIRKVLLEHLKQSSPVNALSLNEVGICRASTIVDVLHVDDKLNGFEIKSDMDNLLRLPKQVQDYNKVCDVCTIVVGEKYGEQIVKYVPEWWGIYIVKSQMLEIAREPKFNEKIDKVEVISLLWKEESQQLLKEHKLYHGMSSYNKKKLQRAIYDNVPFGYVHDFVLERMKNRDWRRNKVR